MPTLPQNKQWTQPNQGDYLGSLWATWNVDLERRQGRINVSPRFNDIFNNTDSASLGIPVAFIRTAADGTDRHWAIGGTKLFKTTNTTPTSGWAIDAISGTPTTVEANSDMVEFEGALIVSLATDIARLSTTWDASWWDTTLAQAALTTGIPHPLNVGFNNLLLIGDGNVMHTVDRNSNVSVNRLRFKPEYEISWIRSSSDRYWIGCRHKRGGIGRIFVWDGSSENFNQEYEVKSARPLSCVIKNDLPFTMNDVGQLLGFNGNSFQEVARLPFFNERLLQRGKTDFLNMLWGSSNPPVHRNGMALINDQVHILMETNMGGGDNTPLSASSGIWCFNPDVGLYHRFSISQWKSSNIADYGAQRLERAGALYVHTVNVLAGARVNTSQSANKVVIASLANTMSQVRRAYIITPKITSSEIKETFQQLWVKFRRLASSSDKIIVKYRTSEPKEYPIQPNTAITWSSTTVFTSTDAKFADVVAGNEVEILFGLGSGTTAHVSTIAEAGGTYTVTLDEAIPNVSSTSGVRIMNWSKTEAFATTGLQSNEFPLSHQDSEWIQFKIELRSDTDSVNTPELEELQIVNAVKQPAK